MLRVSLKNRIRVFRAEHRLSQDDLARLIGVSRKTISTIEVGRFVPSHYRQLVEASPAALLLHRDVSCHRFRANEVRLQLSVLAYNLGNLWRRLVLPPRIKSWSLTSLQQRLVKTGGRLVKHARYYWLLLAEGHLTRRLFGDMLRRIWALPVPAG